ncbi:hypothetical protein ADUPG1_007433, partial [Aduncisulcus paluster]
MWIQRIVEEQEKFPECKDLPQNDLGLHVKDGSVFIPKGAVPLKKELIGHVHDSRHIGINATLRGLKELDVRWKGMKRDVTSFVHDCLICQRDRMSIPKTITPAVTWEDRPFFCIAVDTIGPFRESSGGNKYVLSAIDTFTRFIELFPIQSTSAEEAGKVLLNRFITRYGVPGIIRSDNGSQFVNSLWECIIKSLGLKHHRVIVENPQGNGIVERSNKELLRFLKAILGSRKIRKDEWDEAIYICRFYMNTQVNSSTGLTPFEMAFARKGTEMMDLFKKSIHIEDLKLSNKQTKERSIEFVKSYRDKLDKFHELAREIQDRHEKERQRRVKLPDIETGKFVWLKPQKRSSK